MKGESNIDSGKCSICGHSPLVAKLIDEAFEFSMEGESVTVTLRKVPVRLCEGCGETYSGPDAARMEHEAICDAMGLLTPTEIKAIRDKYGWSQQHLADLTDFGIATVSRWERGRLLQNRSANKVLEAIRDCQPFREYLSGRLQPKKQSATLKSPPGRRQRVIELDGPNSSADRKTESGHVG